MTSKLAGKPATPKHNDLKPFGNGQFQGFVKELLPTERCESDFFSFWILPSMAVVDCAKKHEACSNTRAKNSTNLEPKYQNESLNVNWPNIGKQIENILPHATAHRYRLWTLQWYPRSSYKLFKHMWFGAFSAWKQPIPLFVADTHRTWGGKGQISWSHQKATLQQQKLELLTLYNCSSTMKSVPYCLSEWASVIHHLVRRCYINVFRVPFFAHHSIFFAIVYPKFPQTCHVILTFFVGQLNWWFTNWCFTTIKYPMIQSRKMAWNLKSMHPAKKGQKKGKIIFQMSFLRFQISVFSAWCNGFSPLVDAERFPLVDDPSFGDVPVAWYPDAAGKTMAAKAPPMPVTTRRFIWKFCSWTS